MIHSSHGFEIRQTTVFRDWLADLRDRDAERQIRKRIVRFEAGLLGDVKSVGHGVTEARVHYGPGYRLYFVRRERVVIVLLCAGDKCSQARDIEAAKAMAAEI